MLFSDILSRLGLSENEAKIYEMLLLKGETKARDLLDDSGLSRGNVYNMLMSLTARGLIQVSEGKQQTYSVTDPTKLSSLIEERKQHVARLDAEFKETLPRLLSTFSLTTGRPTVRVFEGIEGVEEALNDSLLSTGEIRAYVDNGAVTGDVLAVNNRYVKKRFAQKILKKILVADTTEERSLFASLTHEYTQVVFIPNFPATFHSAMEIYDDTVSYLTLRPDKMIAVLITDPSIASLEKQKFDFLWNQYATPPISAQSL